MLHLGGCQVTTSSSTRSVAYGFQQPGYVPVVQQLPSSVIPLSSFCSNNPNSSSVIPGVVAYPNQLMTPVNQLPAFTQVPPPTLQWADTGTGRQGFVPQNACVRIVPGVNVPKVDYTGSVILSSAKLNWPVSDKKSKVISFHFILCNRVTEPCNNVTLSLWLFLACSVLNCFFYTVCSSSSSSSSSCCCRSMNSSSMNSSNTNSVCFGFKWYMVQRYMYHLTRLLLVMS